MGWESMEPWELPASIADRVLAISGRLEAPAYPNEIEELRKIVSDLEEYANDLRAGFMNDNDRLSLADHLAPGPEAQ